jgi:hypothetical protein
MPAHKEEHICMNHLAVKGNMSLPAETFLILILASGVLPAYVRI